jgi:hypothetical protein
LERADVQGIHQGSARHSSGYQDGFAGIKNDKELRDLWGYLKQFAADGNKK